MADVATRLRTAREQAGLTIEDIAGRTKISPVALRAIERGDFERLPGEFFTRAFLRTYAQELRLPVTEVMAQYDASKPMPPAPPEDGAPGPMSERGLAAVGFQIPPRPFATNGWTSAMSLAALAIVAVAIFFATTGDERPNAIEPRPVGTSGDVTAPAAPAPPVLDRLTVEIQPTRPLWVTAHADGKRVIFRTIKPGERVVVEGAGELSFRLGDAGAFEYTINGAPGRAPGRSGEVRAFRITRDNYRELTR